VLAVYCQKNFNLKSSILSRKKCTLPKYLRYLTN
jgi:hypothetical protein